ncbi:MAG: aminotransferase class III-fold pyridoxal phosphate-dependent enzyme, partial [Flavobacterium sp.]|nr:aminotransferase class III-fold pyridoxal phosphate-dependent enzyme [Flavobacterium sp.]
MEISHAEGSYIYDTDGNAYLDMVAGVSANTLGHQPQRVNDAIKKQLDAYSHVMVYGEYAQHPATELCKLLAKHLPYPLTKTYLVNSGTEAIEGALKLAR